MKKITKVLALSVVTAMAISTVSVFATETEKEKDFKRPGFAMHMKDGERKFGKRFELTEEQKAEIAEKMASGEFKPMGKFGRGKKNFGKRTPEVNGETTEVTE